MLRANMQQQLQITHCWVKSEKSKPDCSTRKSPSLLRAGVEQGAGNGDCQSVPKCICTQSTEQPVTLARRRGWAVPSHWRTATRSLWWWQVALCTRGFKEVAQSQVDWETEPIMEKLVSLCHTNKSGRTLVFPSRRAVEKTAKNWCWGRVANLV